MVVATPRMSSRNSRNWLNLGLLLLVGGLITVAIMQPGIEPPAESVRVTDLDAAGITRMTLTRSDSQGHPPIEYQRDQRGHWQMQTPYRAAANRFVAADLAALLAAESSAHYPLADIEPAGVSLQPPLATLTLDKTELHFGDIDPVHGNRYLQVGNTVHLVPDHLTPYPELGALEMLSTALLPHGAMIESMRLPALPADANADTSANAGADALPATLPHQIDQSSGSWSINPPLSLSGDALPGLINEWTHAQAIAIAPLSSAPSTPLGRIEITLRSGQQLEFQLLQLSPELMLARPDTGLRYQLSQQQANRLLRPSSHNPAP